MIMIPMKEVDTGEGPRRRIPMEKTVGKAELNKQKKKTSLLDSAYSLFTMKGFNDTSVSDIVRQAGVAKGTFYLYFNDKFDLRNKLIASQGARIFLAAIEDLSGKEDMPFEDQVIFLVDTILDRLAAEPMLVSFMSKHLSWGVFRNSLIDGSSSPDSVREAYKGFMSRSPVQYRHPDILLYMIIEFISGASYNAILYDQPCSLTELKPHLYDGIRAILRSAEAE